jgi:hypothetical protein
LEFGKQYRFDLLNPFLNKRASAFYSRSLWEIEMIVTAYDEATNRQDQIKQAMPVRE